MSLGSCCSELVLVHNKLTFEARFYILYLKMSSKLKPSHVAVLYSRLGYLSSDQVTWMDSCVAVLSSRPECLYRWFRSPECIVVLLFFVRVSDVYLGYQWPEWIYLSMPQIRNLVRRKKRRGRRWWEGWVRGVLGYWGIAVAAASPMVVWLAGGKGMWHHRRLGGGRQSVQRVSVEGWRWLRAAIWLSLVGGRGM